MFRGRHSLQWLRRRSRRSSCLIGAGAASSLLLFTADPDRKSKVADGNSARQLAPSVDWLPSRVFQLLKGPVCECQSLAFPSTRRRTIRKIEKSSSNVPLSSRYQVHWDAPLGEGAYGTVYAATDRDTGEKVALKKISKLYTNNISFRREMEAFLELRKAGGHPNICSLHENFDEGGYFYLILDLISGGEMFDHLIQSGAYSEADAARLIREVASALAFIHGVGIVHGDLKPENLMLSTEKVSDSVIKLIDFGCAQLSTKDKSSDTVPIGNTTAYCPPEVLSQSRNVRMEPSLDMWSLGVILYIMLVGCHPYDLSGQATNEEVAENVLSSSKVPELEGSDLTSHLSDSAIDVIQRLLTRDAQKRITAQELLSHPWVRGETAKKEKISDSDKKLSKFHRLKSQIAEQIFEQMFHWADQEDSDDISKRMSLIERSFRKFDVQDKGFLTPQDVGASTEGTESEEALSLSAFSDLLSEQMKNKYFRKDEVVYREGEEGNEMFFINSGVVEISTKSGFHVLIKQGDFVGEGALLSPDKIRSATVTCKTPVHAIEVNREYFEKYLAGSQTALSLKMREKNTARALNRTKIILRKQNELKPRTLSMGDYLYKIGDDGNELYILEKGKVDVQVQNHTVFTLEPGEMCGEHALIVGRPHGTSAECVSKKCRVHVMTEKDFLHVLTEAPKLKDALCNVTFRREFQKAVVLKTKKHFPHSESELREVFEAVDLDGDGSISLEEIRSMVKQMDPSVPEQEINGILNALDIDESGSVDFDEFKHIFGLDRGRKSKSK